MQQKTIFIILAVALLSSIIGGGVVFLATSKNNPNQSDVAKSTKSVISSITNITSTNNVAFSSIVSISSKSEPTKTESSQAQSETQKSSQTTKPSDEKPTGQKFTGWLGSVDIEVYLNFNKDKVTGKYYNSYDKKWYNLDGIWQPNQDNQNGVISLSEFDNGLNNGNLSFFGTTISKFRNSLESQSWSSINPNPGGGYNSNIIPSGAFYNNTLRTLNGNYNDKTYTMYDVFVSSNPEDISAINTPVTKEFIIRKLDNGQPYESTIFEENGKFYFTLEDWKIPKDVKEGDKVSVTGKLRTYNNQYGFNITQAPDWKYESTNQGFFQIKEVKKI